MALPELLMIAVALGADAFSVAVGLGACWNDLGSRLRASAGFGLAQFVMPVVGWTTGGLLLPYVETFAHWVAFAVLVIIAGRMLWESFRSERDPACVRANPTAGLMLVGLSLAVSIDALAVGFTMGTLGSARLAYAALIGVVAAAMTWGGMSLAHQGARHVGTWAERGGAVILLAVAVRILLS